MDFQETYQKKLVSIEEAASLIQSDDRIGMAGGISAPIDIMNAIAARYQELENVEVYAGLLMDECDHLRASHIGHIHHNSMFLGPIERKFFPQGNVDIDITQFSKVDFLARERIKNNISLMECSPPDENGYMSFGPMGATTGAVFLEKAEKTIVQVNRYAPNICGRSVQVHVDEVDYICEKDHPLAEIPVSEAGEAEKKIASYIVDHIPDGAAIQIGIGTIADAVGSMLEDKNDLGVHTEMLTNSMVKLAKMGVITCRKKNLHPDKIIFAFGMGTREMYDFMHQNDFLEMRPVSYVNDTRIVGSNDNLISVNSTLAVDLTGQVCSESIGFNQFSGTGGQLDFVRGARYSKGGKSFIALLSTAETKKGRVSKINCILPPGSVVTTPRTDTMYVVTEYGIADVWGKNISDRVKAMISIAHPDFRDQLLDEARENKLL